MPALKGVSYTFGRLHTKGAITRNDLNLNIE